MPHGGTKKKKKSKSVFLWFDSISKSDPKQAFGKPIFFFSLQSTPLISSDLEKKKKKRSGGLGFPGGPVVKNRPANEEDMGSIPGPGRCHMPQSN